MYEAASDPYCYPGTSVLINKLGIRDQKTLDAYEAEITAQRAAEPLPFGRLSYAHYRAIHRHLFQDVYPFAGKLRTIRIAKGGSMFCYPEHIDQEMKGLFRSLRQQHFLRDLDRVAFARMSAHFLAELNAIHPFREGNGRTQLSFLVLLAETAGHPLTLRRLKPGVVMDAMIASFKANEAPLAEVIESLIERS